ncbi:MAG: methionyl-tRNA formyltransferase [Lachnospiraceae bacterium]|nr:methionyl-tRNA formyltransferase [Lachnospiraceae bacterium]
MKIVYMGTPDFSVGPLEALIEAGHEISLVVCQPDRPKGRSKEPAPCPVKECAMAHGLKVFQPERIKRAEAVEELKQYPADVFVVAAFGQILSQEILDMPKYGCLNIHASLLPAYRGAAPIQYAVINGDKESGVTIMQMDAGIDTGDILMQRNVEIAPDETGGSLFDKLSVLGSQLITEALEAVEKGELTPVKQDEAKATHVGMLSKEDGRINWFRSAEEIERLIRGTDPWPGAYTGFHSKVLKIWKAEVADMEAPQATHGMITGVAKDSFSVACGTGTLKITELQIEGKKRMSCADFLRGVKIEAGEHLG